MRDSLEAFIITNPEEPTKRTTVAHCAVDEWDFDARYTDGVCPICGWKPPGDATVLPGWYVALQRVPWDFVGLGTLAVLFIVFGVLVARAAKLIS